MSTPSYTQAEFKAIANGISHGKFAQCQDTTVVMNRAVRFVLGDIDLRSMKRSSPLSYLFAGVYEYGAPSDLKGNKLIDIRKQVNRNSFERFLLVDETDFDRMKSKSNYRVALSDASFSRILKIDGVEGSIKKVLHNCDSKTANGTWVASGDASNITVDSVDFIEGSSLNFDTATGAVTAILANSTGMTQVDLSAYDQQGSVFLWVYIPDTFTITSITNFILRWGNDSSNYWSKTVTTNNEAQTFHFGWNLLRFDWSSATQTGTVAPAAIDYLHFTITKSGAQAADTDWRIDNIVFQKGAPYDVLYYSKFGWTTTAGVYIEEATTTTDLIIADTDEVELIAFKAAEFAEQELKDYDDVKYLQSEYQRMKMKYESVYPSEALKVRRDYGMSPRFRIWL